MSNTLDDLMKFITNNSTAFYLVAHKINKSLPSNSSDEDLLAFTVHIPKN